jgi:hypothetical protein
MPTAWASLTGVVRCNEQQDAAVPSHFVFQLPPEFAPALIEDRAIKPSLLLDSFAVLFAIAFGRPGHIANLQILNTDKRVVFADSCSGLVQKVFAGVSDTGVNLLNFGFLLLPIASELDLAAHSPLVLGQTLLVLFETIERGDEAAVRERSEAGNSHVDTDCTGCSGNGLLYFALSLDAGVPFAARLADGDVLGCAKDASAVAVPHPAELGEFDATIGLVDLELLGVGVAKSLASAFALEAREQGALLKEILVCALSSVPTLSRRSVVS